MARRIKKPPVESQLAHQWLDRYEAGETPPQIARKDCFDIRTVRKHIELAKQEKERRQARSIVLRQALEKHYADLCEFARKLDLQVNNETDTITPFKADRMWSALRRHLPRSVVWKSFDRMDRLREELTRLGHEFKGLIQEQVKSRSGLEFIISPDEMGLSTGMVDAIYTNAYLLAQDKQGLLGSVDFELIPNGKDLTIIELGTFRIGKFYNEQVAEVRKLVAGLLDEVITWPEYSDMCRLLTELGRVRQILHEELAVVILRRVVPGRCKYCPI